MRINEDDDDDDDDDGCRTRTTASILEGENFVKKFLGADRN